jgi:hypothetical protein
LAHRLPHALPGRHVVLFTVHSTLLSERTSIDALDLDTGQRRQLIAEGSDARYSGTGHLLFARRGALLAQRFDPVSLTLSGEPVRVIPDVMHAVGGNSPGQASGVAQYAMSSTGTLAFLRGGVLPEPLRSIGWWRPGHPPQPIDIEPRSYLNPRLSPDGQSIVVAGKGPNETINTLFLVDPRRATATVLLRDAPFAVWAPDGTRVIVAARWQGAEAQPLISVPIAGGEPERLAESKFLLWPSSVSSDGKFLAYVESNLTSGNDVLVLGLNPRVAPRPIAQTSAEEAFPTFSPDGTLIAYTSDESGRPEAYIQRFPDAGRHVQVSRGGARQLSWSRDGKSLFYLANRQLSAVTVERGTSLRVSEPRVVADALIGGTTPVGAMDIAEDGSFLVRIEKEPVPPARGLTQLQLIVNALGMKN